MSEKRYLKYGIAKVFVAVSSSWTWGWSYQDVTNLIMELIILHRPWIVPKHYQVKLWSYGVVYNVQLSEKNPSTTGFHLAKWCAATWVVLMLLQIRGGSYQEEREPGSKICWEELVKILEDTWISCHVVLTGFDAGIPQLSRLEEERKYCNYNHLYIYVYKYFHFHW